MHSTGDSPFSTPKRHSPSVSQLRQTSRSRSHTPSDDIEVPDLENSCYMGNQLGDPDIIAEMLADAEARWPMKNKDVRNKVKYTIHFSVFSCHLLSLTMQVITPHKKTPI